MTYKEVITRYSKPAGDVAQETSTLESEWKDRVERQQRLTAALQHFPVRKRCICCAESLQGTRFDHHGVGFIECHQCGHIQTANQPSLGYPHDVFYGVSYSNVYPELSEQEYCSRRDRIYRPKLDWILSTMLAIGYPETGVLRKKWVEIGSGAGYFLSAANERGVRQIIGLEADEKLVARSRLHNPDVTTQLWKRRFENALDDFDAELYCSFFVLEHVDDLMPVWNALRRKPSGTFFAFSVPIFGFSCLLEQAFANDYARNLDGILHTQLFTDASICHGLKLAGYTLVGEWIFGQDILDLTRLLQNAADRGLRDAAIYAVLLGDLRKTQDALQGALDINRLADQRHLLAVRN